MGSGGFVCFKKSKKISTIPVLWRMWQGGRATPLYRLHTRRVSRILVRRGPAEIWPQMEALRPTFAQNRGFSLKIAWKLHDLKKILGATLGGLGPHWIRCCIPTYFAVVASHALRALAQVVHTQVLQGLVLLRTASLHARVRVATCNCAMHSIVKL